ncbi:hypothetical protein [Gracilibacillus saliphilus]|uniref:hypothetical protein n=1 Tax=Gracilibacillus saliphilus TaxID=543890 RepID=UPI0013D594A8|nr:hypothetical protein [Gracilibacillus saliphilus]
MKEVYQLTKFFISSYYNKPKQTKLQVVLLIAFVYLFIQITVINLFVYLITDTHIFIVLNLVFSNIIVFVFVCYLSFSHFFEYHEFQLLAPLPLSYKKIAIAKLISSLLVPLLVSLVPQIVTFLILVFDFKIIEAIQLLIYVPFVNAFTAMFLLFMLSFINRYYYKFKSKVTYLFTNIVGVMLIMFGCFAFYEKHSQVNITVLLSSIKLTNLERFSNSMNRILSYIFDTLNSIPVLKYLIAPIVSTSYKNYFIIVCFLLLIIGSVMYYLTIKNVVLNYARNALSNNSNGGIKRTKVYITPYQWFNYLQREIWVINTEPYFKMQVVLGILFPPVCTTVIIILINYGVVPIDFYGASEVVFDKYFAYAILFFCCINNISGTPYSREGKYWYLLKCSPLNNQSVYFSKVAIASIISIIALLLSYMILAVFGYWHNDTIFTLMIIASLVVCYNLLAPLYDRKHPLTEWGNPSEAVKSNLNVLVSLLYGLPLLFIMAMVHLSMIWLKLNPVFVASIILMLMFVTLFILISILRKKL